MKQTEAGPYSRLPVPIPSTRASWTCLLPGQPAPGTHLPIILILITSISILAKALLLKVPNMRMY